MRAACMEVAMVTYKREDRQSSFLFPTNMFTVEQPPASCILARMHVIRETKMSQELTVAAMGADCS